jgi:glycosyltransferase involved in cell wall biosynthesis
MRILLLAHGFPRRPGDLAGAFLLALARGQQALGHDVLAVVPHDAGLPADESIEGVRVHRYRYGADSQETLAYRGTMADQVLKGWGGRVRLVSFIAASRRATARSVARFAPDVVHVHWWFPGGLAVWPRFARSAPPYVMTSHGTDLFLLDRLPAARAIARPIFRGAAEVTVISSPLVARAESLGVSRSRISVIPMPVDDATARAMDEAPRSPGDGRTLLFVGRLIERKGAAFAVRAVAELARQGRDVRLVIVGDGPERAALSALATSLDVAGRIELTGALATSSVRDWYERATILLMPTITDWKGEQEGFGMVVVEAMAHGIPVVASRSGGIPDIIRDGETGVLVPEGDANAIAASVARLLDHPAEAERLGAAARADVRERFAPTRIAAAFDTVYRRATRTLT